MNTGFACMTIGGAGILCSIYIPRLQHFEVWFCISVVIVFYGIRKGCCEVYNLSIGRTEPSSKDEKRTRAKMKSAGPLISFESLRCLIRVAAIIAIVGGIVAILGAAVFVRLLYFRGMTLSGGIVLLIAGAFLEKMTRVPSKTATQHSNGAMPSLEEEENDHQN